MSTSIRKREQVMNIGHEEDTRGEGDMHPFTNAGRYDNLHGDEDLLPELGPFECECGASYAFEVKQVGYKAWSSLGHFIDDCEVCNETTCHECGLQCNVCKKVYCKIHADDYLKETGICEDCTPEEDEK